jgi:hypothetical protein
MGLSRRTGRTPRVGAAQQGNPVTLDNRRPPVAPLTRDRAVACLLMLIAFYIYIANGRVIAAGDSIPARLIPYAILLDHTVTLDRYFAREVGGAAGLERMPPAQRQKYYFVTPRHGRLYSSYPMGTPVLVTPLHVPILWLKWGQGWPTEKILHVASSSEKYVASAVAALSVAVMYLLLAALADRGIALALTAAFAFGTSTWTSSSQALWQHGPGVLLILLTLAVLVRHPRWLWAAGIFAGLAVAVRPTNLFFWVAFVAVHAWMRPPLREAVALALPGVMIGSLLAISNWLIYHDLRGGYGQWASLQGGVARHAALALAGLLISPNRGLFIYSPVLLAGVAGLWFAFRRPIGPAARVYAIAAIFLASQLICFATWSWWWGGYSYGSRLLTEAAAVLVVLSVAAAQRLRSVAWTRVAFTLLLAYSVGVQAIGAFTFAGDKEWNNWPVPVDSRPERLWDWHDTQIGRTFQLMLHPEDQ